MYNNESGGGGSAAASATVAVEGVKAVNNVESKAWDISRFFGLGKALATTVGGKVAEGNKILSSP